MNVLIWIQDSALGTWVAESIWGYPIVLASHALGMAVVVGTMVMINLRVLGFARNVPVTFFDKLSVITWAGPCFERFDRPGAVLRRSRQVFLSPCFPHKDFAHYPWGHVNMAGSAGNAGCARYTGRHAGYAHPGESDGGDFIGALVLCDYRGAAHRLYRTLKRMNDILFRIEGSALGQLMRDSIWLFPMAEILHFMGLSLLIGSLLVVDFRLLGFSRNFPVETVYKFLPLALIGFTINLVTGAMFFFQRSVSLLSEHCVPAEAVIYRPGWAERVIFCPDRTWQSRSDRRGGCGISNQDGYQLVVHILAGSHHTGQVYSLCGMKFEPVGTPLASRNASSRVGHTARFNSNPD